MDKTFDTFMKLLCYIIICIIINNCCSVMSITTNNPSQNVVCLNPTTSEINRKLSALQSAFPQKKTKLDFVIVIDRSQSIQPRAQHRTINATKSLFDYLVKDGRLYLHKEYARIAVLSFGKTITLEFEGITDDERTFDGCETSGRIDSLNVQTDLEGSTELPAALSRVATLFNARQSQGVQQILWVFYDGDLPEGDKEDTSLVDQMSKSGVIIFSAAVGRPPFGWMDTIEEENRVISLAKDKDHAACLDTWMDIFQRNTPTSVLANTDKVFSAVDPSQPSQPRECDSCANNSYICACDTTGLSYGCYACSAVEGCDSTQNGKVEERKSALKLEWWLIVILICIGVVLFFSVLSLVVFLVYRRKYNNKPEVPPRPRKHKQQKDIHIMDDDPTYYNKERKYEDCEPDPELAGDREDVEISMDKFYTNEMEDDRQLNMPGWDTYLFEEAQQSNIGCLGVFSLDSKNDCKAWTPQFKVSKSDLKSINKILTHSPTQKKTIVKLKNHSYNVNTLSPLNIHATLNRQNKGNESSKSEDLHITKVDNYLIIGIADNANSEVCQQKVCDIRHHLENNELNYEKGVFTNVGNYNGGMYATVAS